MALVSGRSSALNPNAPLFIPAAFRQVEDFSPQWWQLVKSSTWFRDYWLSQHKEEDFGESGNDSTNDDVENMLSETFDLSIEEDFNFLENEFEQLMSHETLVDPVRDDPYDGRRPLHGLSIDAKAVLKNLTPKSPKSPKERGPKSPLPKHLEKPAQYVNIKCAPQRIHQPR